jgi:hypothetical protein
LPFLLLYVVGFSYVAFCSLWHLLLDRRLPMVIIRRKRGCWTGSKLLSRGNECSPEGRKPSLERA